MRVGKFIRCCKTNHGAGSSTQPPHSLTPGDPATAPEVFLTNKRGISSFVLGTAKQVSSSNVVFY